MHTAWGCLRDEERWAQVCIQHTLPDCTVEPHDDGSSPSMYDLKIVYPDGSIGAVEVTAAADGQRVGLWREVRKRALIRQEPDLIGGWLVRVLRSARARDLDRHLTGLLRQLEHDGRTAVRGVKGSTDPLEALAASLGVLEAVQSATDRKGSIYVMPPEDSLEQMGGYSPFTGDPLAVWLGDWTTDPSRSDNVRKLQSTVRSASRVGSGLCSRTMARRLAMRRAAATRKCPEPQAGSQTVTESSAFAIAAVGLPQQRLLRSRRVSACRRGRDRAQCRAGSHGTP